MRKLWIGAAMAALLVTGCQAGTFHGADGTKNQAVVRESGAGDTAASGNYVNSADAADQVSRSSRPIVITSEPAVSMTNTDDTVTVTGSQVNIRSSATTASQSLGTVSQGETLKRTGKGDSWSRVVYNGKEAYISNRYITVKQPDKAARRRTSRMVISQQRARLLSPAGQVKLPRIAVRAIRRLLRLWHLIPPGNMRNFLRFLLAQPHYTVPQQLLRRIMWSVSMPDTAPGVVPA